MCPQIQEHSRLKIRLSHRGFLRHSRLSKASAALALSITRKAFHLCTMILPAMAARVFIAGSSLHCILSAPCSLRQPVKALLWVLFTSLGEGPLDLFLFGDDAAAAGSGSLGSASRAPAGSASSARD